MNVAVWEVLQSSSKQRTNTMASPPDAFAAVTNLENPSAATEIAFWFKDDWKNPDGVYTGVTTASS